MRHLNPSSWDQQAHLRNTGLPLNQKNQTQPCYAQVVEGKPESLSAQHLQLALVSALVN